MKLNDLIKRLEKIKEKAGNVNIVVDYDENGWYDLEEVKLIKKVDLMNAEFEKPFVNLKSSNEC